MSVSKQEIISRLQLADPDRFESFVAELWERQGWETEVTSGSRDEGIDVIATQEMPYSRKLLIQAKCYRTGNKVSSPAIQQYNSLKQQRDSVDEVLIVCTSGFTDQALKLADELNVKCISGGDLAELVQRTGARDLLRNYTDKIDEVDAQPVESSSDSSISTDKVTESSKNGVIGHGEWLSVEVIGIADVSTQIKRQRLGSNYHFDGKLATTRIFAEEFGDILAEEVRFVDQNGQKYSPAPIDESVFPDDWKAMSGPNDIIVVNEGSTNKIVFGVALPRSSKLAGIEFDNGPSISFDHQRRDSIRGLPEKIREIVRSG